MKLNTDKCKVIICGKKNETVSIKVGNSEISEEDSVKLLGIKIDNKLNFDKHISKIIKKANSKITVIQRSFKYLSFYKRKILFICAISIQLCPTSVDASFKNGTKPVYLL